jgi:hypothetical protein
MDRQTAAILIQSKSLGVGLILTFLFGGLGLFYVSVMAGIIGSILELICIVITLITFGIGAILLIPFHIICFIWAVVAVNNHNKRLIAA